MLGTAVFQHFARSQSWERLFLPFSCVPKVGNNRFYAFMKVRIHSPFWGVRL